MIRFSRILLSRNGPAENLLMKKTKGIFWHSNSSFSRGISTPVMDLAANDSYLPRGFASYTIYKGKAALTVSPKLPKFSKLDSGSVKMDKSGVIFLEFSPAVGQRKYDWERKQIFALSPTEVGGLISLGPAESCEFLHDPSMKSSLEGQVKKSLSITPLSSDGGYFLNLNVINTIQKTNDRISVPMSKAEFTVMRTALSYALPHIMGWDQVMRPQVPGFNPQRQQKVARLHPEDIEWGR